MPRKLGPKLILSLTVLIVAISGVSGYLNFRSQKKQLLDTDGSPARTSFRAGLPEPRGTRCSTMIARPAYE